MVDDQRPETRDRIVSPIGIMSQDPGRGALAPPAPLSPAGGGGSAAGLRPDPPPPPGGRAAGLRSDSPPPWWGRCWGRGGIALLLLLALAGCAATPAARGSTAASPPAEAGGATQTLRLATTTSTADSGLLDVILPGFERQYNAKVDVVAVGTGQALRIGESGDADVVLVHARKLEDAFVSAGNGVDRRDVMYNDFVIVGPTADPARIGGMGKAADAFGAIAEAGAPFAARGDGSGTATREAGIWATTSVSPTADMGWYKSLGQGMGATLTFANEQRAYALTDRGTFLSMADKLPNLKILVGGQSIAENTDGGLLNPYGVIVVNPATHPGVNSGLAEKFAAWLISPETQAAIGDYGKQKFGQPLFYPGVPKT